MYTDAFCQGKAFQQPLEVGAENLFKSGELFLFDPMAGNQCHLMAYRIAMLYRQHLVDRPLLCASMLIDSCFNREKNHISAVARIGDGKGCAQFLTQTDVCQIVKRAVVQNICSYILKEVGNFPREALLHEVRGEGDGYVDKEEGPYPKFAGVKLLLLQLRDTPLPVVLKIKVLSESDHYIANYMAYRPDDVLREATPEDAQELREKAVLTIEGMAAQHKPIQEFIDSREKCFHNLIVRSKVKRHKKDTYCRHCLHGSAGLREQAVDSACGQLKSIRFCEFISAAGAAFTHELQPNGEKRLLESALKEEYEGSLHFALVHHISVSTLPSICMVEHVYPDLGKRALSMQRLVDKRPTDVRDAILQGEIQS